MYESVSSEQRFTSLHPCPICGGHYRLPSGRGVRCFGFLSSDGRYAHCTREDFAGGLERELASNTYAHRLGGLCRCGVTHQETESISAQSIGTPPRVYRDFREAGAVCAYDYRDEHDDMLFQVWRYVLPDGRKTFKQARPIPRGWTLGISDVRRVLYRLPELLAADPAAPVLICEGEKDADRLADLGLVATTAPMGAGKWTNAYSEMLRGRHVVGLLDNDSDGEMHGRVVGSGLMGIAADVRLLRLPALPQKGDVSDWLDAGGTPEELEHLIEEAPIWTSDASDSEDSEDSEGTVTPWNAPIPLPEGEGPEFRVSLLPKLLAAYVSALALATQTPVALVALLVLGTIAIAAAKRVTVQVRPGWVEPVNLFTLVSLGSGNRKSAVVEAIGRPLRAYEADQAEAKAVEIAQAQARRDMEEKRLDRFQKEYAREDDGDKRLALRSDIQDLAERLATDPELRVPTAPRLLVDDFTPERLAALMADNNGRMGVLSAEGGIFQIISGRYKDKGAESLDLFLKGHSGDDMPIDRVNRATKHLRAPALTLALAVQPEVLAGLAAHQGFRGQGLLARFAYASPVSTVGRRRIAPPPVPQKTEQSYNELIKRILDLAESDEPLTLSPAAAVAMIAFERDLEPRLGPEGDLEHLADWGAKLAGLVARLAALLHVVQSVTDNADLQSREISNETIRTAITIAETFLIPHAKSAFALMGADPAVERARHLLRVIRTWPEETVSLRDLHQKLRATFIKPEDLDRPLALLEGHGYIRRIHQEKPGPPGPGRKPSPLFEINPLCRAQNSQNAQYPRTYSYSGDNEDSENGPANQNGHASTDDDDPWAEAERFSL